MTRARQRQFSGARPLAAAVLAAAALGSSVARAQTDDAAARAELEAEAELLAALDTAEVEIHGFVSQGFLITTGNDYIAENSTDGSFELTEVGINFTHELGERLRVGVQLFAQDFGTTGDFRPRADWFYLDYRGFDWLGLRVGRITIPYGLYNETRDIDSARVPVLLPGSVYPLQSREILFAHNGGELHGYVRSPHVGAFDYRVFAGTIFIDSDEVSPPGAPELSIDAPYVMGARLLWDTPLAGLRLGGSWQATRLETTVPLPGLPPLFIETQAVLWVGSLEYTRADLTLTAEYSGWRSHQHSNMPPLSPTIDEDSERTYVMASYRFSPWFVPAVYYSLFFPNADQREGRENVQHDAALTLRFDVTPNWLVKLEGHYMVGTAALVNPLRVNPPDISREDEHWGAFFAKTTAHF